ncbi:zf-HC2 domain-containing protein [Streptomyces mexicanus]|jgi:predicted anti-sigma-YlaC factor YlaD|uniref:Zf-HC2 domain-containing protein n=1 Tax=Streptomyces mexicanus TaxID=178566 RepID=A0A7X1I440_9ACTN|nr:zf-HC2 domain-containing protein [Streptomyces mexicanus]MBC2868381.1 zf-HC2 domain-containing protein [Streptomyces mexicanus]
MTTSVTPLETTLECRTVHDLLAGHALNVLAPEEAAPVSAHLASCSACRDEHDCLAAVAAHLSTLRAALAGEADGRQPGPAERPHAPRQRHRRNGAARGGSLVASLTLSQWVSRLAYVR